MHVDLSFSYLRSAATASFDKKEFHRNCTLRNSVVFLLTFLRLLCSRIGLISDSVAVNTIQFKTGEKNFSTKVDLLQSWFIHSDCTNLISTKTHSPCKVEMYVSYTFICRQLGDAQKCRPSPYHWKHPESFVSFYIQTQGVL